MLSGDKWSLYQSCSAAFLGEIYFNLRITIFLTKIVPMGVFVFWIHLTTQPTPILSTIALCSAILCNHFRSETFDITKYVIIYFCPWANAVKAAYLNELPLFTACQGVVSLTFHELSKIFSRILCTAEIVLLMRMSSWHFVRVPKAMLWAHVQSFSLKSSP